MTEQTRPLHVALVIAGLGAGGAERVISLLAKAWADRGYRITLIAFDAPDAPVFHEIDGRVELVRLGIAPGNGGLGGLIATLRRLLALQRSLRACDPDVAVAFLTKVSVLTLLAGLSSRCPIIVSERNNPRLQRANSLWRLAFRWLCRRADAIVLQTRASIEAVPRSSRGRVSIIANPIAIGTSARRTETKLTCVATGRLTWQKGFDLLIEAFARIAMRHPGWQLTIWGEGERRSALQGQIDASGFTDRILLAGNSASPEEWVAQADAFALPSRFEGFPNVLGEAMAAGLPVIAFDCAYGPADLITAELDGLLVPDGDVSALAAALDRLLGDEVLRSRLGAAARAVAHRLQPDAIAAQWDAVLAAAILPRASGLKSEPNFFV